MWIHVSHTDSRARQLADRHYSRQTIGAREFTPPGNKIVLISPKHDALWVSHRPDPTANLALPRRDGFNYWDNPYFRSEGDYIASELIIEALGITRYIWGDDIPPDGFHSFIDPRKVRPTMRRGERTWGYCYLKAGFELHPRPTKVRELLRFVMSREQFLEIAPIKPNYEQLRLFEDGDQHVDR
jgi:hypothetical protein